MLTTCTALSGAPALAPVGDYVVTGARKFICDSYAWRRQYTLTSAADRYTFAQLASMPLPHAVREIARTAFPGARASRLFVAVGERVPSSRGWVPHPRRAYLPELDAFGVDVPTLGEALRMARHGEVEGASCRSPLFIGCDEAEMELVIPDDDDQFDAYIARLFGDGGFGVHRVELRDDRNRLTATLTHKEGGGVHRERHPAYLEPPSTLACRAVAVGREAVDVAHFAPRARTSLFHRTRMLDLLRAKLWTCGAGTNPAAKAPRPTRVWMEQSGGSLGNAPPSVVFHAVVVRRWNEDAPYARNFSVDLVWKIAEFCGDEAVVPRRTRVHAALTLAPFLIHLQGTGTEVVSRTLPTFDALEEPCRRAFVRAEADRDARRDARRETAPAASRSAGGVEMVAPKVKDPRHADNDEKRAA